VEAQEDKRGEWRHLRAAKISETPLKNTGEEKGDYRLGAQLDVPGKGNLHEDRLPPWNKQKEGSFSNISSDAAKVWGGETLNCSINFLMGRRGGRGRNESMSRGGSENAEEGTSAT